MANDNSEPKNCWEIYSSEQDREKMNTLAKEYIDFLSNCKTERETINYAINRLEKAKFVMNGDGDAIIRQLHGKSLFAAIKGTGSLKQGLRLIGTHGDTPRLDLKQHPLQEQCNVGQAKTHYYGGIRKYQWFSRPIALHGTVIKQDGTKINIVIGENLDDPVFTISDLLPHLAQGQADQPLSKVFEAEKMNIILAHQPVKEKEEKEEAKKKKGSVKTHIINLLKERYNIVEEDLYSAEIQAVPAGPARFVGLDSSLVGGYGQDDRINVFLSIESFIDMLEYPTEHTRCIMIWDKEEIGSEGSTGAKSRFFEYCVQDIIAAWEPDTRFSSVMLSTKALSADVHAAIDPDWQDLHEKLNSALIGCGPCFCKFTGHRGKYEANDAHPEYIGWLRNILNKKHIPWQLASLGKVDGGGGGTVAMYLASYGMNIIDCGPAILSMHSPFELSSKADIYATKLAFDEFFQA